MSISVIKNISKYQLRHAAGQYWLLDMEQSGLPYRHPLSMNELGAEIWNRMLQGRSNVQIAEDLSKEYEVTVEEILEDIESFQVQLKSYGIIIGE